MSAEDDLKQMAEAIRKLAFEMPAPNPYTPRFVLLANAADKAAMDHQQRQQAQYRRLMHQLPRTVRSHNPSD